MRFLAYNSLKTVWWPGSARTHWGEHECSPDPLAAKNRGPTSKGRGREGREGDRMGGEGKRREENGRGGEGEGAGRGEGPHNANSWIRLCPK